MTRFARAKGSKASNERVPEVSTPWHVMKEQLEQRKQEVVDRKRRKEIEATRMENYKAFLDEKENDIKPEWVNFEEGSNKQEKTAKSKKKRKISQNDNDDLENEPELQHIISEIEKVLDKEEKVTHNDGKRKKTKKVSATVAVTSDNQNKLKKVKKNSSVERNISSTKKAIDVSDNEDAPEEISAKIIPTPLKNKKKAKLPKKVSLHISSVNKINEENSKDNENLQEVKQSIMNDTKNTKHDKGKHSDLMMENANECANSGAMEKVKGKSNPKKSLEKITEDQLKRINKKKAKRMRQLQNKKMKKAQLKEQALREQENQNVKRKLPKVRDNEEHKRRKPDSQIKKMTINGVDIDIDYYDGFPVKKEDAERLRKLRKEMISKGIPKSEVLISLKLERRKAEKALAREKKKVCFNCRKSGHILSECPDLNENSQQETTGTGICFKCGSTEHTHFECKVVRNDNFKYAKCFICQEQGHISRQCPDNQRGLYPKGGACRVCGDVTHLKKDCPKFQAEQESQSIKLDTLEFNDVEGLSDRNKSGNSRVNKSKKIVTF